MVYPVPVGGGSAGGPGGYTYAAVVVRAVVVRAGAGEVQTALREVRFSGWLAPPEARRRPPPPAFTDPPRGGGDPWLL